MNEDFNTARSQSLRMEDICQQYRSAWQSGQQPQIKGFLTDVPEPLHTPLLQRLVRLDLQLRSEKGETATPADYYPQFPDSTELIDHVFRELQEPEVVSDTVDWNLATTDRLAKGPDHEAASLVGSQFDRFSILEALGRGAFGTVYRARDRQLDRDVALKVPRLGALMDGEELARFLREARAAAQLRHPHIVPVHDVGQTEGLYYIVSELVEGQTLRRAISDGRRFSFDQTVRLIAGLATALHFAHNKGIVHRDVKPENVMLDGSGEPHVMDFGLARRSAGEALKTMEGAQIGTPAYMSPEQAKGESHLADARSDLWALGVMLYELLTGRRPFHAQGSEVLLEILQKEPIPPRRHNPAIPRDLETITLKCLAKAPDQRYPSCQHLADELHRWLRGETIDARSAGTLERSVRWCRRNPVLACLAAAAAFFFLASLATVSVAYFREAGLRLVADSEKQAAISAKSREEAARQQEAQARKRADRQRDNVVQLLARRFTSQGIRAVDEGDLLGALVFFRAALERDDASPERRQLHWERLSSSQYLAPRLRSLWLHDGPVSRVAISQSGRYAVSASWDKTARVFDLDLDLQQNGPVAEPLVHTDWVLDAAIHPDQQRFITATSRGEAIIWNLAQGTRAAEPLQHGGPVSQCVPSPDGRWLATAVGQKNTHMRTMSMPGPMRTMSIPGPPRTMTIPGPGGRSQTITMPGTPTQIQVPGSPIQIQVPVRGHVSLWDLTGDQSQTFAAHAGWVNHLAFSPDSKFLLSTSGHIGGNAEAQIWEVSSGEPLGLPIEHPLDINHGEFQHDGKRFVVATGSAWGPGEAQVYEVESQEPVGPPLPHAAKVVRARFHPDGRRVLTASWDGTVQLWEIPSGRPAAPPMEHRDQVTEAVFSHDGRYVLTASRDGTARMWHAEGGQPASAPLPHNAPVLAAALGADGSLAVTGDRDGVVRAWEMTLPPGFVTQLQYDQADRRDFGTNRATFTGSGGKIVTLGGKRSFGLVSHGKGVGKRFEKVTSDRLEIWDVATQQPLTETKTLSRGFGSEYTPLDLGERFATVVAKPASQPTGQPHKNADRNSWQVRLVDTEQAKFVGPSVALAKPVSAASASHDGRCVATVLGDGTCQVWQLAPSPSIVATLEEKLSRVIFSPQGRFLAGILRDNAGIRVWDAGNFQPTTESLQPQGAIRHVAFSPDDRLLLATTGQGDFAFDQSGEVSVWITATGQAASPPLHHHAPVTYAEFSPDASQLVTASEDGMARIWQVGNPLPSVTPLYHREPVNSARFSTDGQRIVTASDDRTARIWDTSSGEAVTPPLPHPAAVRYASFHPDGSAIVTAGKDAVARVWFLSEMMHTSGDMDALCKLLSGRRIDETGSLVPVAKEELEKLWQGVTAGP